MIPGDDDRTIATSTIATATAGPPRFAPGAIVGVFIIVSGFAVWAIAGHHAGSVDSEFEGLLQASAIYIMVAAAMCVIYLALEPWVRRFWPDSLLGWSRLIAGHIRDPRVGRDVLLGAVFGVATTFVALGRATVLPRFGFPAQLPVYGALEGALLTVLVFVVLRLVLRRASLAIAAGVVLMTLASAAGLGGAGTQWVWLFPLARGVLLTFVVVRFGLLATVATLYFSNAVINLPSLWALLVFIAMAFFAFSAARAGQPLFGRLLADDGRDA